MPDPTSTAADLAAVCDTLTAADDNWRDALPFGAQIHAQDHEYDRDRITIGEHTLYRDDTTNTWHVLGWSNVSRARNLPRATPLSVALGLPRLAPDEIGLFEDNAGGLTLLREGHAAEQVAPEPGRFATDCAEIYGAPILLVDDMPRADLRTLAAAYQLDHDATRHVATWRPDSIYGDPATVTLNPPMGAAAARYIGSTAQEA